MVGGWNNNNGAPNNNGGNNQGSVPSANDIIFGRQNAPAENQPNNNQNNGNQQQKPSRQGLQPNGIDNGHLKVLDKDDLEKYAKKEHQNGVGEVSYHINPDNNAILKNIDPRGDKNPNEIKVCIHGNGDCFVIKKDDKGNYNWPDVPTLPPPLLPAPVPEPKEKKKPKKEVKKVEQLPRKKFDHSANFTFIFLRPTTSSSEIGKFEVRKLTHQRWLDLVLHEFDEQERRNPGSDFILVSHHKLVRHTGHINNPRLQALIGYAMTKKYLRF